MLDSVMVLLLQHLHTNNLQTQQLTISLLDLPHVWKAGKKQKQGRLLYNAADSQNCVF